MIKINFKKAVIILVIILLFSEFAYRASQGPILDIKDRNEKDINIVNDIYINLQDIKNRKGEFPIILTNDIINTILKNSKDINQWNKYGYYKLLPTNNFLIGIKLNYIKYLKEDNIIIKEGKLYKDFYYKIYGLENSFNIDEIYNNLNK